MTELELYKKYRPVKLTELVGQKNATNMLVRMVNDGNIPRCLLFTGPSGTGKTSAARILRTRVDCSEHDFVEINAADTRGIDTVREIKQKMNMAPMGGESRVWLIDEFHAMTSQAQQATLKILEDTPKHVYFFLATTDPNKLLKTILTRSTEIRFKSLSIADLEELLKKVCSLEKVLLPEDVLDKVVICSDGSARKALVLLHQIYKLPSEAEQLEALEKASSQQNASRLFQALLGRENWSEVAKILKELDDEPEMIRRYILAACSNILLGNKKNAAKAYSLIVAFESPFHDSGKAGLIRACWEVIREN